VEKKKTIVVCKTGPKAMAGWVLGSPELVEFSENPNNPSEGLFDATGNDYAIRKASMIPGFCIRTIEVTEELVPNETENLENPVDLGDSLDGGEVDQEEDRKEAEVKPERPKGKPGRKPGKK